MHRALLLATLAATWPVAPQQLPPFRSGVQTVPIHVTVHDRDGRLVTDLARDAFRVFDNGAPAEITLFARDPQPITVVVLLDMSGSMTLQVVFVRTGVERFIEALQPVDRARIGSFGEEVWISPHLTADKDVLRRVLREELWPGGGTPMWHALDVGLRSIEEEHGRRVVLVLTDGGDTGGLRGWRGSVADIEHRAIASSTMMYGIFLQGSGGGPPADGRLVTLIDDTGGGRFHLARDADLAATFARVAEELRYQYLLGFSPAALDDRRHRLRVEVVGEGLRVRARRSYLAIPEGPDGGR